jgi:microcystin-dependent protein
MSLYPENPEIGEVFNNRQWSGTAWVALNNPLSVEYTTDGEFTQHTSASANVHGIINSASVVYADDAKLSDERTPLNQSVTDSKIVSGGLSASVISGSAVVQNDLDAYLTQSSASSTYLTQTGASATYAPSASPTFTGTVALPLTTNYDGTQLSTSLASKLDTPVGAVMYFAMNTAPTGWLKANGAAISRSTYAALFAAIGTTFGVGDGSTTFTLPDLRGEFVRGWDDGRSVDTGRTFASAQDSQNLSHTHGLKWGNFFPNSQSPGYLAFHSSSMYSANTDGSNLPSGWMVASGGTESRPRNIAMLACIKF